jgi:Sigma-70, region 4
VLRDRDLLASWLYGVALRVATRSRRDRTRRRIRERTEIARDVMSAADDGDRRELWSVIDAEVARLPARFRTPIVLCYFEGLTHDQAAERIGCPVGTVRSRMSKGRDLLRSRLTRRGLAPTPALLAVGPIPGIAPAVPPSLSFKTIAAAASLTAGRSIVAGIASTSAITLTRGVLQTMSLTRWTKLAAAVMVLGALGGGIGVAARQHGSGPARKEVQAQPPSPANPVRKALQDALDGINEYEKKLKVAYATIEKQHSEILALKARIDALESRGKAEAPGGGNARRPKATERTVEGEAGDDAPVPDSIEASPRMIVAKSATNDRVVVYAIETGTVRTYRPPTGATVRSASVWQNYVQVIAEGPKASQVGIYDPDRDRWATQDLRGGPRSVFLRPPSGQGVANLMGARSLTQVAIFDFHHFRWSVQDLLEPSEGEFVTEVKRNVASYVQGRHIYAYSAEAGRWDTLILEKRLYPRVITQLRGPSPMKVSDDSIAVSQDGRLHVFTAKTGRWHTIDPKD